MSSTKQKCGHKRQVIAFGGCGVADLWVDPRVFRYVLHATGVGSARVALLASASGDDQRVVSRLHRTYRRLGAVTHHLELDPERSSYPPGYLSQSFDLIHVEGGNATFLMHQLRRGGMDSALREAWEDGVVLTGTSAGASCWFAQAMSASLFSFVEDEETMTVQPGLGFLPGSICVHFDISTRRREAYYESIAAGLQAGFGLDHDAGLHFDGTTLKRIVARRPGVGASEVKLRGNEVNVKHMEGDSLGPLKLSAAIGRSLHVLLQSLRRRIQRILIRKAH